MNRTLIALLLAFAYGLPQLAVAESALSFVPWPRSIELQPGETPPLTASSRILYETRETARSIESSLGPLAKVLAGELELVTGVRPQVAELTAGVTPNARDLQLRFQTIRGRFAQDEAAEDQAYELRVTPDEVIVTSQYTKGVAYGTTTLLQALRETPDGFVLPCLEIDDHPAAAFRNVMIDVARQPHSIGVLKDAIRMARMYKLRYVQLHLTDDQHFTFPFAPVTDNLEDNHAYTRAELIDLVAYADVRGVTLIPELDLPGHSTRLRQSGYLSPNKNDADVASPENAAKINAIIDDMLSVFRSSPYFHIGGDESRAGRTLVPFLASVNEFVRGNPTGGKRRLLVWEGFHGAPTKQIPPTGDDRVVVMAWESSYNPPWDLLNNGYTIINASWKPTYACAGPGGGLHAGWTTGRQFYPRDLYGWDKNTFMHWEQGRPVYEDRGPNDPDLNDGVWNAEWIGKQDQILGGQMLHWEQRETAVINQQVDRLPVLAQKLWGPDREESFEDFEARSQAVNERVMTVVQPVQVLPKGNRHTNPLEDTYQPYEGESASVRLVNRTRIEGEIRYELGEVRGGVEHFMFQPTPTPTISSPAYDGPIDASGGFSVRAQLFRKNGEPVDGHTWKFFINYPNRVRVTSYNVGRRTQPRVQDLASLPDSRVQKRYELPMLRGGMRNVEVRGLMTEADLTPPASGDYTLHLKTANGHASLYLDTNRNGQWEPEEKLISDSPNNEALQTASEVELDASQRYRLRIDHNTGMPRPVLVVYLEGPGTNGRESITRYLSLPDGE